MTYRGYLYQSLPPRFLIIMDLLKSEIIIIILTLRRTELWRNGKYTTNYCTVPLASAFDGTWRMTNWVSRYQTSPPRSSKQHSIDAVQTGSSLGSPGLSPTLRPTASRGHRVRPSPTRAPPLCRGWVLIRQSCQTHRADFTWVLCVCILSKPIRACVSFEAARKDAVAQIRHKKWVGHLRPASYSRGRVGSAPRQQWQSATPPVKGSCYSYVARQSHGYLADRMLGHTVKELISSTDLTAVLICSSIILGESTVEKRVFDVCKWKKKFRVQSSVILAGSTRCNPHGVFNPRPCKWGYFFSKKVFSLPGEIQSCA